MRQPINRFWFVLLMLLASGVFVISPASAADNDRIELTFGKSYIPKDLQAGEKVHVRQVLSARINARGGLTVKGTEFVNDVEVIEVVVTAKPENPLEAARVSLRVNQEQSTRLSGVKKGFPPLQLVRKNPAREAVVKPELTPSSFAMWGNAGNLFTARVTRSADEPGIPGPTFEIEVDQVLHGTIKKGDKIKGNFSAIMDERPDVGEHRQYIVAQEHSFRRKIKAMQPANEQTLAQARLALQVPAGWSFQDEWLVSPWSFYGEDAWPPAQVVKTGLACAETGRPALLAGANIEFGAEPILPKEKQEGQSPDGNGEFRVWVRNISDKPVEVPALLFDGQKPLWNESLVVVGTGASLGKQAVARPMVFSEVKVGPKPLHPTLVGPGEVVSGVVDIRNVPGLLPRFSFGKLQFEFALGEKRVLVTYTHASASKGRFRGKGNRVPAVPEEAGRKDDK